MGATLALTNRALIEAIDDPRLMEEEADDYSYKEISCITRTKAHY